MKLASNHPILTGLVVIGVAAAVAPQIVAGPVLNAAGFGGPGVMASTYLPTDLLFLESKDLRYR